MGTMHNASLDSSSARRKVISVDADLSAAVERRVATPRSDLLVIKIGDRYKREAVSPREKASGVLARVGKVMSKPGTDRKRVFKSISGRPVYAYSIDPKDTSKLIREDSKGVRIVGRLVSGKFRPMSRAI